jgi:hypothetical protein
MPKKKTKGKSVIRKESHPKQNRILQRDNPQNRDNRERYPNRRNSVEFGVLCI